MLKYTFILCSHPHLHRPEALVAKIHTHTHTHTYTIDRERVGKETKINLVFRRITKKKKGFDPTHPKRTEFEWVDLDHSATDVVNNIIYVIANSEIRTRDLLFTKQMH